MLEKTDFYINGAWVAPDSRQRAEVINPSDEKPFATIALGNETDLEKAVTAARAAFTTWRESEIDERRDYLSKLADTYKDRAGEMAELISREMGAPIALAQTAQTGAGLGHIKQAIRSIDATPFVRPIANRESTDHLFLEPVGVIGMITPWNWPMNQITLKVAPAIAAGCTMILKPSELAPLSAMLLAEIIDSIGLPRGVFNLVNGDGAGVGSMMSAHPGIDMISFTGSTRAGRAIAAAGAETIKRVSLELGGKGANIIFADADEKAVGRGVRQCFLNSGQSCNAPTRMLVEASIYADALEQAKAMAVKTETGLAATEGRHIGPVANAAQFEKIQGLIEKGIAEGAKLLCGGAGRPDGMETGYFVRPTIFADVTPEMTIFREEIFGPVLCIMPFEDEDEAVRLANDTAYGLTNYIQTEDNIKARRVAERLRSGMVEINGQLLSPASPFSGRGLSGNGVEGGILGIEEFLVPKAVSGLEGVQAV